MDIQVTQILFQIVNFSVVVGALTFLLFRPVKKMLDERSSRIEEGQKAAEKAIAEQRALKEMEKKIRRDAEREAAKVLDAANQEVVARRKEVLAQAKKEADEEHTRMMENFEQEKLTIMGSIKMEFADAVIEAVKHVGISLDKKEQSKLIDTQLDQLLEHI